MYYLIGVLGTIVGAFLTYAILTFAYGEGYGAFVNMDTFYLNMTLFLAYASMFPEMEVYLYMILPIKVKWLGYLDGLYLMAWILRWIIFNLHFFKFRLYSCRNFG